MSGKKAKAVRRLSALLLVVLLSSLLCSCHGARALPEFSLPEEFDETRQYEISFWAKNDTNKAQTDIYKKAIADFEAIYPNITVNLRLYTDYGRIYNDVITNIATRTTPNVCITYPDHIATYMTGSGVIVPLDELLNDPDFGLGGKLVRFASPKSGEIIPQFLNECKISGQCVALPFMRSSEVCYVNRDFVEQLGYTLPETLSWDFIWEVSEAALEKNGDGTYKLNGQKVMIPFIYKSTDNMMIQMLAQKNAGYSDDAGNVNIFNDVTKELLYTVAEHAGSGAFSTFKISSYPANFLNAGQCVFAIDSTAGATWMGSGAPLADIAEDKFVEFETEVMLLPQYDAENIKMISQGPSVCVFNKSDNQEVLASWLFAQYLLTDSVQISYSQTEGYVPVTSKAQQSEIYRKYLNAPADGDMHYHVKLDAVNILLAHIGNTFVTPVWSGSASLRDAAGAMIEAVTKSMRRREVVDEAYMQKLKADITSLYHLEGVGKTASNASLGKLPIESVLLLSALSSAWLGMGIYALCGRIKKRGRN